jgi:acetyl-CoA decarbonylase/synthase complex subunit delta
MALELLKDKWTNTIGTVKIGATKEEGGSRGSTITVGGETTLPFLLDEGKMPNKPVVAMEVLDVEPKGWPVTLTETLGDSLKDPVAWAKRCVEEFKADLICLALKGTHPEEGNISADKAAETVKNVLGAISTPLIILGSGDKDKDNDVLAKCSQATKGENCLFGLAQQENFKTLTASCMADGHCIITDSPIDINIAKQVNILVTDMGFKPEKIVMHPSTAALGYGMEYVYSIMERARLAAFVGDKMLSMPFILFVGDEIWRVKEATATASEQPGWGDEKMRGILWETATSINMLNAGADILVMRHPSSVATVKKYIDRMMKGE